MIDLPEIGDFNMDNFICSRDVNDFDNTVKKIYKEWIIDGVDEEYLEEFFEYHKSEEDIINFDKPEFGVWGNPFIPDESSFIIISRTYLYVYENTGYITILKDFFNLTTILEKATLTHGVDLRLIYKAEVNNTLKLFDLDSNVLDVLFTAQMSNEVLSELCGEINRYSKYAKYITLKHNPEEMKKAYEEEKITQDEYEQWKTIYDKLMTLHKQ